MCFYHDSDWYAEVSEDTSGPATKPTRCNECRDTIPVGGWVRHIFQQEHDEVSWDPSYEGEEFSPGESYEYDRCEACDKVFRAIEAAEVAAGCKGNETQPGLSGLRDALFDIRGEDDDDRYAAKVGEMFPEAVTHYERLLGR